MAIKLPLLPKLESDKDFRARVKDMDDGSRRAAIAARVQLIGSKAAYKHAKAVGMSSAVKTHDADPRKAQAYSDRLQMEAARASKASASSQKAQNRLEKSADRAEVSGMTREEKAARAKVHRAEVSRVMAAFKALPQEEKDAILAA